MLCEVGWVISGKRSLYLSGWYWRIKQRKGAKRATIALARKLLALIYTMLKTGSPYNEDCFEIRRKQSERKRASRMVNELQKLGYFVVAPGLFPLYHTSAGDRFWPAAFCAAMVFHEALKACLSRFTPSLLIFVARFTEKWKPLY